MDNIKKSKVPLFLVWLADTARLAFSFVFRRHRLSGEEDIPPPFFIIGCGRSGNTLLRSILVTGKEVVIPPESYVWPRAIRRYRANSFLQWEMLASAIIAEFEAYRAFNTWEVNLYEAHQQARRLPRAKRTLSHILHEIYLCYAREKGLPSVRWGDKTPINTLYADKILKVFPGACFIFLERDPRDVACSYVKAGLYKEYDSPAYFWKACYQMGKKLRQRLKPEQFYTLRYEDMVSEPRKFIAEACDFLNIKYSDEMLDFWQHTEDLGDVNYRAHHANIKSPISTDSIGKWKTVLTEEEAARIVQITNFKN